VRRRAFIAGLAGAAALPLSQRDAGAQKALPVIGFLDPTTPDSNADSSRAFRQGLKETGFVEGENVAIVYRFAENQSDRLAELAADLVRRRVNLIVTYSSGALAAKAATKTSQIGIYAGRDTQGCEPRGPAPAAR